MFDHADADYPIESSNNFAVIAQLNFNVQSAAPMFGVFKLFFRNCYADYLAAVLARGIASETAPAAADVEQAQAGLQTESLTNPLQLSKLGGSQIVALIEQRAGILHVGIEHRFEKVVAQIVMNAADFSGTAHSLPINSECSEPGQNIRQTKCETPIQSGTHGAAAHFIERVAIPPSVHVRFAKTERAGRENAAKEAGVVHLYVPWPSAIDLNIRDREKIGQQLLGFGHRSNRPLCRRHRLY